MVIPEADRSQFPVSADRELTEELDRLAGLLTTAIEARATAGRNLPDFKGAYADKYQTDLGGHSTQVGDMITMLRRTAGNLRRAVEKHQHDTRQEARGL